MMNETEIRKVFRICPECGCMFCVMKDGVPVELAEVSYPLTCPNCKTELEEEEEEE